jgi:hypothetical protein
MRAGIGSQVVSKAPRISSAALQRLGRAAKGEPDKVTATRPGRATTPRVQRGGQSFDMWCIAYGLPEPVAEHRFHPVRRWRFDWCWIDEKIAVEQEGGIWTGGRHTRGKGYANDCLKYNCAAALGWRLFRFTPADVRSGKAARFIRDNWEQLTSEA